MDEAKTYDAAKSPTGDARRPCAARLSANGVVALSAALLGLCSGRVLAAEESTNPALPEWAPEPPPNVVEDRFRVEVLLLGAGLDTTLRIDQTPLDLGTPISAEDDLGLDDSRLLALAEITLLPGERHMLRLNGFSMRRSSRKTLARTIDFDDQTYLVGEAVDSELNFTMFGFTYGYSIIAEQRTNLALTFGIQVVEVEANAVVRSRVVRDAETGISPLPLAGLEGRYDFTPRWSMEVRAQYLSVEFDDIDGSILDARAAVTWRMNPHLVFGLGYRRFNVEVESGDDDTPGVVDLDIDGPLLFVRASL